MKNTLLFLLLTILLLLVGCSSADDTFDKSIRTFDKKPQNYPDALILLPNATGIKFYELGGTYQLMYRVSAEYPAREAISTISDELNRLSWTPLTEDYLNPGLPSSHIRGWTLFGDATKSPQKTVHQWLADWENQAGDILTYGFRYTYKTGGAKDLKNMTVFAIFVPAPLAKAGREAAITNQKAREHGNK